MLETYLEGARWQSARSPRSQPPQQVGPHTSTPPEMGPACMQKQTAKERSASTTFSMRLEILTRCVQPWIQQRQAIYWHVCHMCASEHTGEQCRSHCGQTAACSRLQHRLRLLKACECSRSDQSILQSPSLAHRSAHRPSRGVSSEAALPGSLPAGVACCASSHAIFPGCGQLSSSWPGPNRGLVHYTLQVTPRL